MLFGVLYQFKEFDAPEGINAEQHDAHEIRRMMKIKRATEYVQPIRRVTILRTYMSPWWYRSAGIFLVQTRSPTSAINDSPLPIFSGPRSQHATQGAVVIGAPTGRPRSTQTPGPSGRVQYVR